MTFPTQARPSAPKKEEKKLPGPSPETLQFIVVPHFCHQVKYIPIEKLAQVAMVLDFSLDD